MQSGRQMHACRITSALLFVSRGPSRRRAATDLFFFRLYYCSRFLYLLSSRTSLFHPAFNPFLPFLHTAVRGLARVAATFRLRRARATTNLVLSLRSSTPPSFEYNFFLTAVAPLRKPQNARKWKRFFCRYCWLESGGAEGGAWNLAKNDFATSRRSTFCTD